MQFRKYWAFLFVLAFIFSGFALHPKKLLPVHDEILRVSLPFDLTYLRTTEAVESIPYWKVERTIKEEGYIQARNTNFSRLDDADRRVIIFQIKRVSRQETSVQIAPESQRVIGGAELMKRISEYLHREL